MVKVLFGSAVALSLCGCAMLHLQGGNAIKGSGNSKTETRTLGSFSGVAVEGSADCEITVGGKQSVTVTWDDNLVKLVTTEIKNGTLIISQKESTSSRLNCKVKITVPKLQSYDIAGSGDATIAGLSGGSFTIGVAGSGDISARGSLDKLDISIEGSGDVDTRNLKAKTAKVSIAGSGDVKVAASASLDVSIAGSGDVTYFGNPKVTRSIVGAGDVHKGD